MEERKIRNEREERRERRERKGKEGNKGKKGKCNLSKIPRLLERRSGSDCGIDSRLAADARFSSRAILNEVRLRLNTTLIHGSSWASQMVFA